jgi:hypothetical protein
MYTCIFNRYVIDIKPSMSFRTTFKRDTDFIFWSIFIHVIHASRVQKYGQDMNTYLSILFEVNRNNGIHIIIHRHGIKGTLCIRNK